MNDTFGIKASVASPYFFNKRSPSGPMAHFSTLLQLILYCSQHWKLEGNIISILDILFLKLLKRQILEEPTIMLAYFFIFLGCLPLEPLPNFFLKPKIPTKLFYKYSPFYQFLWDYSFHLSYR